MTSQRRKLAISVLACLAATIPLAGAERNDGYDPPPNANHIFNAIHSSMRQWGSSLNHNGMSFFMVTVPKGTQFYHGTSSSEPVNGTEWLAFEPEHAMGFARPRGAGPPGGGPPGREPPGDTPLEGKPPRCPSPGGRRPQGPPQEENPFRGPPSEGRRPPPEGRPPRGPPQEEHPFRGPPSEGRPPRGPPQEEHPFRGPPSEGRRPQGPPPPPRGPPQEENPFREPPSEGRRPQGPPPDGRPPRGPPQEEHPLREPPSEGRRPQGPPSEGRRPQGPPSEGRRPQGPPPDGRPPRGPPQEEHPFREPPSEGRRPQGPPSEGRRPQGPPQEEHPFRAPPSEGRRPQGPPQEEHPFREPPSEGGPSQRLLGRMVHDEDEDDSVGKAGYLHTYAAAKDLRLLYVDGMSGGKSAIGTLDSQDRILFNDSVNSFEQGPPGRGPGGPAGERDRAIQACKLAKDVWNDRIDGILRMEAGFEIILCSFERDLEVVRITQAKGFEGRAHGSSKREPGHPHRGMKPRPGGMGHNNWLKAVAARYHGIGGHRVMVDYDHFVTAYTYGLDLFPEGATLPRLKHLPTQELEPVRQDVHDLVMNYDPSRHSFDWQSIADMIVTRYSDELQVLAAGEFRSIESLRDELDSILGPFIDYSDPKDSSAIADRCAEQFIPHYAPKDTLAGQVVRTVSQKICSTLTTAMLDTSLDLETALNNFQDLIDYLSWSTWKECRGCAYDELCVVPMWPMGTVEDYEHPRCKDPSQPETHGKSYWGHFGGPPPQDHEDHEYDGYHEL